MQVQIAENWADLEGDVRSVTHGSDVNGFDVVELDVQATRDVGAFPNFFAQSVGEAGARPQAPQGACSAIRV